MIWLRIQATSNPTPSGISQGTPGGLRSTGGRPGSLNLNAGPQVYLWVLVILEILAVGCLRKHFRRYHGG